MGADRRRRHWVRICDTLLSTGEIGQTGRPSAIILTHGHFDHVGSLEMLAAEWDVPVYAHRLEHPYLNGTISYPPADPSVGGGLMALLSPFYPTSPIDVSPWLQALPDDHSIPGMPGWHWLHTPGHSPGHVSLWRNADRLLIAGDAFVTTKQESVCAAVTQARLVLKFSSTQEHGLPPFVECRGMLQAAARSPLAT